MKGGALNPYLSPTVSTLCLPRRLGKSDSSISYLRFSFGAFLGRVEIC